MREGNSNYWQAERDEGVFVCTRGRAMQVKRACWEASACRKTTRGSKQSVP